MASPIGDQLSLEESEFVDTLQRCFTASGRTKKLKDNKEKGRENEITDFFLATAGCEAIVKVSTMEYQTNLKYLTFEKNQTDHKKKYETQENVGRGRKNEVHNDETRNWRTNHKISTPSTKCQ